MWSQTSAPFPVLKEEKNEQKEVLCNAMGEKKKKTEWK